MALQSSTNSAWKPEANKKGTSIGMGMTKTSSMNKHKKRSHKAYRGQGK